jgi:hypothetical protein
MADARRLSLSLSVLAIRNGTTGVTHVKCGYGDIQRVHKFLHVNIQKYVESLRLYLTYVIKLESVLVKIMHTYGSSIL